jgi:hypothetical protein
MKIELTDKAYKELLHFKNYISVQHGVITNPKITKYEFEDLDPIMETIDFQPEISFEDCILTMLEILWEEHSDGNDLLDNWDEEDENEKNEILEAN